MVRWETELVFIITVMMNSSNWMLMSSQPLTQRGHLRTVKPSGHKQIHISKLFSSSYDDDDND